MNKTTIGLLSKLMRMTPEAIRFYEKKKIISPKRLIDSKYRDYSLADIKKLYDCKNLRNLNFTIKEVDHIMAIASLEENNLALQKKKEEIEKNIETQLMILNKIQYVLSAGEFYQQYEHKYDVIDNINYIFYSYAKNDQLNLVLVKSPIYQQVMDLPNLFSCSVLFDFSDNNSVIEFGFSIPKQLAEEHHICIQPPAKIVEHSTTIHSVIKTHSIIQKQDLQPILNWIENHGYKHNNIILARLISAFYNLGNEHRYYEIYVPVITI